MEDIRSYNIDLDDTIRERHDDALAEWEAAKDEEVPFEIPRD